MNILIIGATVNKIITLKKKEIIDEAAVKTLVTGFRESLAHQCSNKCFGPLRSVGTFSPDVWYQTGLNGP